MMNTRGQINIGIILALIFNTILIAQTPQTNVSHTLFNINNISTWIYNNGISDNNPDGKSGFEYPKGSGKTAVFTTGFIWAGKVDNQICIGGSTYRSGLQPGKILSSGEAEDSATAKIYRVRIDWETANLSDDIESLD